MGRQVDALPVRDRDQILVAGTASKLSQINKGVFETT